jgi:glycosyltransferase involved in cell wall biosynthesis
MTELSLILPCFDEADRLPATLATYLAHLPVDPGAVEVLVVDDGSTDATAEAARQLFGRARVNGFAFDVELLLLAGRLGLPVAEVPVRAQARFGSRVRVLADGRRMLGEVWSVRRDLDADHRSQRRAYA